MSQVTLLLVCLSLVIRLSFPQISFGREWVRNKYEEEERNKMSPYYRKPPPRSVVNSHFYFDNRELDSMGDTSSRVRVISSSQQGNKGSSPPSAAASPSSPSSSGEQDHRKMKIRNGNPSTCISVWQDYSYQGSSRILWTKCAII